MNQNQNKVILIHQNQRKPIDTMEQDWDTLIILDACRYDYFKKVHKDYLDGKLWKALSPGSETFEWCKKVFKDKYYDDLIYISANPVINSKVPVKGFDAKKHFYKIIDIWDMEWKMQTIHPKTMNKAARKYRAKYPDKRLILHYIQPHIPYFNSNEELPKRKKMPRSFRPRSSFEELRHGIGTRVRDLFRVEIVWRIRRLLGKSPNSMYSMEGVWRRNGKDGVRNAYERNLRIVLKYVKQLTEKLPGKIIITADHGDLLGEWRDYGHRAEYRVWPLVEVPWFEVES